MKARKKYMKHSLMKDRYINFIRVKREVILTVGEE